MNNRFIEMVKNLKLEPVDGSVKRKSMMDLIHMETINGDKEGILREYKVYLTLGKSVFCSDDEVRYAEDLLRSTIMITLYGEVIEALHEIEKNVFFGDYEDALYNISRIREEVTV